jgi:tRNA nucleotidyltransferase (CCA-adding enzyme)
MEEPVNILLKHVLQDITPSEDDREKESELAKDIMEIVSAISRGINKKSKPVMVGSIAKGTDLAGDKDFDVFVQFPKSTSREDLEKQGLEIGTKFFNLTGSEHQISYAEHPYVKGVYHGFSVEIVPCYDMSKSKKILSAVDRSPLHTEFVLGRLKKKPLLRDEIRLLKKFMKGNNIYGAHAAVEGFSGYLCELLVIRYGSFLNTLKAAKGWKKHEHMGIGAVKKKSFPDAPLVFIDPVDASRNVAAAVSVEKMAGFIYHAEAFLEKPRKDFFYAEIPEPLSKKDFEKRLNTRGTELLCVYFRVPKLVEDTLIPQLSKSLRTLSNECERAGFRVLKKGKWTDGKEAAFLLEFEVWQLPKVFKKSGPFFDSKVADLKGFIESNKARAISNPYLEGEQWAIDVEREFRKAEGLIAHYLKNPAGFGKNLRDIPGFSLLANRNIEKVKNPGFWEYMSLF